MAPTVMVGSALATGPTRVSVFWIGPNTAINLSGYEAVGDSIRWHKPLRIAPPRSARLSSSPIAVVRSERVIQAFWPGTDGSIGSVWGDETRGRWEEPISIAPAGAAREDSQITAVSRFGGWVDLFWTSADGDIVNTRSEPNAPTVWSPAIKIAGAGAAAMGSGLFGVARVPQHVDIFWIAADGRVAGNWWDNSVNDARWNQPFVTAPAGASRPGRGLAVVARIPGHVDVFWVGATRTVERAWWDARTGRGDWSAASSITPPGVVAVDSGLAAIAPSPENVDVFWVGNDHALMSIRQNMAGQNGEWAKPVQISGNTAVAQGSSLSCVSRSPEHLDLFWTAPDGNVMYSARNVGSEGGDWSPAARLSPP